MPLENLAILWTSEIKGINEHLLYEPSFMTSVPVPSTQKTAPRQSGTDMGGVTSFFVLRALYTFQWNILPTVINFSFTFNK